MGYRSDIAIMLYAHKAEDASVLKVWFEQFQEGIREHLYDNRIAYNERGILFHAECTKWYDQYIDVQFIENILRQFIDVFQTQDTQRAYNYEYIRIGEDMDDVEEKSGYGGFRWMSTERSIKLNF